MSYSCSVRWGGLTCSTQDPERTWCQMPLTGNWLGRGGPPVLERKTVTADEATRCGQITDVADKWQMVMCSGYTGSEASFSMGALASLQLFKKLGSPGMGYLCFGLTMCSKMKLKMEFKKAQYGLKNCKASTTQQKITASQYQSPSPVPPRCWLTLPSVAWFLARVSRSW